jgi:hypothetical protein
VAGFEAIGREAVAPFSSLITVTVMVESSSFALTRTPSITGFSAEDTRPVSATLCSCAHTTGGTPQRTTMIATIKS